MLPENNKELFGARLRDIYGLIESGPVIGLVSDVPDGTVVVSRVKMDWQVLSKVLGMDMDCTVTFPSEENMRRSESVPDGPTTRGFSSGLVTPRYETMTLVSKVLIVASKGAYVAVVISG